MEGIMSKKAFSVIAMILLLASSGHAGLTGIGFGVHGGVISGYNNLTLEESVKAAFGDFSLEKNMPDLGIHVVISTLRIVTFDGSFDYGWKKLAVFDGLDLTYSTLSATASVRGAMSLAILKPYVGAGLGLYRNAYSLSGGQLNGAVIVLPADETKVGYLVKAGLELNIPLSPITPFGEFRYNHIPTTGKATHYYQLLAGLTLNLP
jgi:opacity protein-like surface antigen